MIAARSSTGRSFHAAKPSSRRTIVVMTSSVVASWIAGTTVAAMAASSGARSAITARSTPVELRRCRPWASGYSQAGIGNAGGRAVVIGDASRRSTSTALSASWCTKLELAPFSSSLRTR